MIEVDENHGPYIVLAPGVALAHAQPDGSVTHPTMIKAPATAPSDTDEEPSAPGVAPHRRRLDLPLGGIAAFAPSMHDPTHRISPRPGVFLSGRFTARCRSWDRAGARRQLRPVHLIAGLQRFTHELSGIPDRIIPTRRGRFGRVPGTEEHGLMKRSSARSIRCDERRPTAAAFHFSCPTSRSY